MAGMSTALIKFADKDNGGSRTSLLTGHTALKPMLVIEKRRGTENQATVGEYASKVVIATEDSTGATLPNKVSIEIITRYPLNGAIADIDAAIAIAQDILAGDEYTASVKTLNWLKPSA